MHGKGIIYNKNGSIKYEGEFVNNNLKEMENFFIKVAIIILENG